MRLEISFSRPDPCKRLGKDCQIDFAFEDWDTPVPRIGERIWLKGLDALEDDQGEPEWRVWDVWWEPDADDDCPECVVMARLVGVVPDTAEEAKAFRDWYWTNLNDADCGD